jgi:integrase
VTAQSTLSARRRKASKGKPGKPYEGFPLFDHDSGRWAKKIRGKLHYFGRWATRKNGKLVRVDGDGWQEALEEYQRVADALHAGKKPQPKDGLQLWQLVNHFLEFKRSRVQTGELAKRSWDDYDKTCERVIRVFGADRNVADLDGTDFEKLRADAAKTRGPVALTTEIVRVRVLFNFAFAHGLIDKPVRYGAGFAPPQRKSIRKALNAKGQRMFEPAELRALIDAADVDLKAMILLAANSGMGNHDIGKLPLSAVNLDTGWIDFAREKTGTPRRFLLWPDTLEAIKAALAVRPTPKPGHEEYVFLTRCGQCWAKEDAAGTLSREFAKLLKRPRCPKCGAISTNGAEQCKPCEWKPQGKEKWSKLHRDGLGFYCLRRGFQTIGEEAGETATRYIMGHVDGSMSARYRQRISDERLRAVADHVRAWLFGKGVDNG